MKGEMMSAKKYWVIISVLLLGIGIIVFGGVYYEVQESRQNLQVLVGTLYQRDPDMADQVLQTAFSVQANEETIQAGKQAAIRLGYTEDAYAILAEQEYYRGIVMCGCVLLLLFVCGFLLFGKLMYPIHRCLNSLRYELHTLQDRYQIQQHYIQKREEQMEMYIENIAHQIKTPLSGILLNLDLLESRWEQRGNGISEPRDGLQIMRDSRKLGEKIRIYIMKLLNLARMEAGKIHFRQDLVELIDLLEEVQENYGREKLMLVEESSAEIIIRGDRDWLYEAICNIVENSLRYAGKDLPVRIDIIDLAEEIKISVMDQGKGMTPQEMENIFERYHTSGEAETFATGIGLNLAQYVIRGHHGDIYVESKVRQGTKMEFRLPKYQWKDKIMPM